MSGTATDSFQAYLNILIYHGKQLASANGLIYPLSILVNVGGVWILARLFGLQRTKGVFLSLLLCFVFVADRHMVPLNIVMLYALAVNVDQRPRPSRLDLGFLWVLVAFKIYMLWSANDFFLQIEHWYRFMNPIRYYQLSVLGIAAWIILLMGGSRNWRE